jgi:hypothetical protein
MTGKIGELKFVYKMKKHRKSQVYLYNNYQDFSIFFVSVSRVAVSVCLLLEYTLRTPRFVYC